MKLLVAAATLTLLLTGCGQDEPGTASDPGPASESPSPSASPPPSDGPYPDFGPTDYTYVLATSCFCADAGTPIAITVSGDEITDAVLAADGTGRGGGKKGDPAADYLQLTIDDIIDRANTAKAGGAATVTVTWSADNTYPVSVFIDQSTMMADEEVSYTLSDVQVG